MLPAETNADYELNWADLITRLDDANRLAAAPTSEALALPSEARLALDQVAA